MPETTQITFTYRELVETMIKSQGIHEGIWGIFVRFGIGASNIGQSDTEIRPAAIIPILDIGLQKFDKETNIRSMPPR